MDGNDRDLGWEDVGSQGQQASAQAFGPAGQMGSMGSEVPGISDAVTSAMINHFAREMKEGSMSLWPQFIASVRQYFNVNHGYVLRKAAWQIVPLTSTKKKSSDGELGAEKDWTARLVEGIEVDIEEPDLYIPTMGFVSYVLLCGLIRGLQERFTPDTLSATITFAMVILVLETTVFKASLFMAGAVNTPIVDIAALLGYKFFYLSLQLMAGLILGFGYKPTGFFYHLIELGLLVGCGVALWQALRRLARMQPSLGQECVTDVHKALIKGLPVLQALFYWCLMPSWPEHSLTSPEPSWATVATTVVGNSSGLAAGDR